MVKFLVLNGPNMNLLGKRDVARLGSDTLDSINAELGEYAKQAGLTLEFFQSNHEGVLIDKLHEAREGFAGVIFNPGGFGQYSIALKEAIAALPVPCLEVHMANIFTNPANDIPKISPACTGMVTGLGKYSYLVSIKALELLVQNGAAKKA